MIHALPELPAAAGPSVPGSPPAPPTVLRITGTAGGSAWTLPPDWLPASDPFPFGAAAYAVLERLGPVLARFGRVANLIHRRSLRETLPAWIAGTVAPGRAAPRNRPQPFESIPMLRPELPLTAEGPVLTSLGPMFSGSAEGEAPGATPGAGSVHDLWLALLWNATLRDLWDRELRSSNARFLRKLVPCSWIVSPEPLPHQAVLPRLGVRSFAELALPGRGPAGLTLRPGSGPYPLPEPLELPVRCRMTPEAWAGALERALQDHATSPWLLQEYRAPVDVIPSGEGRGPGDFPPAPWTVSLHPRYSSDTGRPRLESVQAVFAPSRGPDRETPGKAKKERGAITE